MGNGGLLFLIIGPAGAGKNSLIDRIVPFDPSLVFAPSLTTRSMRPGEAQGVPYHFVTRREFEQRQQNGDILEFSEINYNLYGTSRSFIDKQLKSGKDVITDVEVLGAHRLLLARPLLVCPIFVIPPSRDELVRRIRARHPAGDLELRSRLGRAEAEVAVASSFDYLVVNKDLEIASSSVRSIIAAERAKVRLMEQIADSEGYSVFRTVEYEIRSELERDGAFGKPLFLPRTRLGPFEDYVGAFSRLIRLLRLRHPSLSELSKYALSYVGEEQQRADYPKPHLEYLSRVNVRVDATFFNTLSLLTSVVPVKF